MNRRHYNNSFRDALRKQINSITEGIFSRDDLTQDHSNREQLRLNRALRTFIDEGIIIKIAHGLFAKAEQLAFPGKKAQSILLEPFETVATKALNKLGVQSGLDRPSVIIMKVKPPKYPLFFQ